LDSDGDGFSNIAEIHLRTFPGDPKSYKWIADFDKDGKTDIAVYYGSTGLWYIKPSSGAAAYGVGCGGTGFTPIPGDYDGDGKTDIVVYRPGNRAWWITPTSTDTPYGIGWGDPSDIPLSPNIASTY
jgi:hypothetical protein